MLSDEEVTKMLASSLGDQVCAGLYSCLHDIERVAEEGPNGSEYDEKLIHFVFLSVAGMLHEGRI